jgi:tetratricopeptide (TPR) repeat protein
MFYIRRRSPWAVNFFLNFFLKYLPLSISNILIFTMVYSVAPSLGQSLPSQTMTTDADQKVQTQIYLSQSQAFFDQGLYQQSMEMASKAININPKNPLAWQLLGNCLKRMGRDREAITAYDQAIEILAAPESTVLSVPSKSTPNSQTMNDASRSVGSDIGELWVERARTLDRLNRFQESVAAYDQALKIRCQEQLMRNASMLPAICQSYVELPKPTTGSQTPNTIPSTDNGVIPVPQPAPRPNRTIW